MSKRAVPWLFMLFVLVLPACMLTAPPAVEPITVPTLTLRPTIELTPTMPESTPTLRLTPRQTPTLPPTPEPLLTAVTRRAIGLIPTNRFPELEVLSAPASVTVNQPFTVTVITHGSSSCTTPVGAKVEVEGLAAIIIPVDQKPLRSIPCSADLAKHPREVELTFSQAGEATIWVIGQNFDEEPTTNEYSITVMP